MPASAAISSRVIDSKDFAKINNSIFQDKYPKTVGIPYTPRILPGIWNNEGTDPPDISEIEAIEIALANGISEDPCCPGIDARYDIIKVGVKWTRVWRVSGPCGKILFIDRKTGEVVGTDWIKCMCFCIE